MEINPFKIDAFDIYRREKEAFENGTYSISNADYLLYTKTIEELCTILRAHLTKKKLYQKRRIDDMVNFDMLSENYKIEKEDNIESKRFPEPDYFTTRTEYYEYLVEDYQHLSFSPLLFAFKLRHTPLDEIYDLIASAEKNMIGDIEEFMYHLEHNFKVLIPRNVHIIIYNWAKKVPKNHPNIFKIINGNGPTYSIYALHEEELEQKGKGKGKGFSLFGDASLLPPPVFGNEKFDDHLKEEPEYELTHDSLSVDFEIEICSIFNTERDQARSVDYQYTEAQLVFLNKMISEVKSYLIFNRIVIQYKEHDKYYFWDNERRYKEETKENKNGNYFPEPRFFVTGQAIYNYLSGYHYVLSYKPNQEGIYELFFAFRLRQMQLQDVLTFLKAKQKEFSGNFLDFLDLVLLKYKCLFSDDLLTVINKKRRELPPITPPVAGSIENHKTISNNTGLPIKSKDKNSPNPLPEGWIAIKCAIPLEKIKAFLSYFYLECNGSADGIPFITKEEFDVIFKYGLAYPEQEPTIKSAKFIRNNKKVKSIFYYFLFHLYQKNIPQNRNPDKQYKPHYVKFLKHHFDGFPASLKSINDEMKDHRPTGLDKKVFNKYLKMLD